MLKEALLNLLMLLAILQPYNVCFGAGALDAQSTVDALASSHHKAQQQTHAAQHLAHLQAQQYSGQGGSSSSTGSSSSSNSGSSSSNTPHHYPPSGHLHHSQHHSQHQHPHQHLHHAGSHPYLVGGGHGSSHIEQKNSYNLLSEAMSQAVSHEFSTTSGSGSAPDGSCQAEDIECYNDRLGMEAIRSLHRQLDDDDNGNIDLSESDDFLREELKYDSGYEKRQKAFHYNDDTHISVKELWEAWLRSEVHNWTIEQTTDWLAQSVQLPQYVDLFKKHKVSGATLPRLAVNNMHYVSNILGIKDPIHKQKIALKAMDVVLFGPPRETGTRWKDYILVTLLLSAIIGCWYAYQQNKCAKRHLRRMAKDMEGLQKAEQSLQEMQKELERARMEQENVTTQKMDLERRLKEVPPLTSPNSDLEVQQLKKEIELLRTELSRAEIELVDNCWAPPPQLQSWLQYTYELESKNHLKKRVVAEKQLQSAREACEKLRKKRSSLVGAFVSTHGKSIDDVDRSIVEARNALGDVTNELQERLHRWKQIEQCLGMNIVNNNGITYLESVLYGGRNGGASGSGGASSSGTLKGSRGRMTSSTDDLDDESVQGMMDNYGRNAILGSNLLREESSGSEDGSHDIHSVQFYLGPSPPSLTPSVPSIPTSVCVTTRVSSTSGSSGGSPIICTTATTTISGNTFAHIETAHSPIMSTNSMVATSPHGSSPISNESVGGVVDEMLQRDAGRHSPSVSSERSVIVPPRTKKSLTSSTSSLVSAASTTPTSGTPPPPPTTPSTTPSSLSGGMMATRVPLPPPRKATQSLHLTRTQSSELMNKEILPTLLTRRSQPITQCSVKSSNGSGCATNSKRVMVKQHSTTSQQSTSSAASSVQSAPDAVSGKSQSPGRVINAQDRTALNLLHSWYTNHPNGKFASSSSCSAGVISSYGVGGCGLPSEMAILRHNPYTTTTSSVSGEANRHLGTIKHNSETQLDNMQAHSNEKSVSTGNGNNTHKKRRRGLRFSFGSKKSQKNQDATIRYPEKT